MRAFAVEFVRYEGASVFTIRVEIRPLSLELVVVIVANVEVVRRKFTLFYAEALTLVEIPVSYVILITIRVDHVALAIQSLLSGQATKILFASRK